MSSKCRAHLRRHAARHLAHRRQQRQAALGVGDGFIGDAGGAGFHQALGLFGIGGQMQIGEKNVMRLQPRDLDRLRLLHLDDHVGGFEHLVGIGQDLRAGLFVILVGLADARARAAFDKDLMAIDGQLMHHRRHQADAEFQGLDLFGDTDFHGLYLTLGCGEVIPFPPPRLERKSMLEGPCRRRGAA